MDSVYACCNLSTEAANNPFQFGLIAEKSVISAKTEGVLEISKLIVT